MTDERAAPAGRLIDVTSLPEDVAERITALLPGEALVVIQDGEPIAAISSTRGAFDRTVEPANRDDAGHHPADGDRVTVVATAMKLSESARASLSAELGAGYIVVDMHAAPAPVDVLLVPPASPQLIGGLRSLFSKARVIVTEIEDDDLGVSYHGPVRRMLDAGAETYLTSTTIRRLAGQLDHAITRRRQIVAGDTERPAIEPSAVPPDPDA